MNNTDYNINFTARNPQIRDAQWVSHTVNAYFPHLSSTRIRPKIEMLIKNNSKLFDAYIETRNNPLKPFKPENSKQKKLMKIFDWYHALIRKVNSSRDAWKTSFAQPYRLTDNILMQLKLDRLGNCGEDALVSQAIVKINGGKAICAQLEFDNKEIDHSVCLVTKNKNSFNGKIDNDTIIIDSWFGIADYAKNVFRIYKNLFNDYFYINKQTNIKLKPDLSLDFTEREIEKLRSEYPELIYKGKNFMQ